MGPDPEASSPPRPEAAPQKEAAKPAAATEAAAAAPDVEAGSSLAEPAAEGAAAMAEAAVPEAAGAAEITALEAAEAAAPEAATSEGAEAAVLEEEETVVVLGRCLLPSTEVRLGDRINSISARYAEERAKLVLGRELPREEMEQARDREAAALQREKAATWREAEALKRHIAMEEKMLAAADRERTARELAAQAKKASAVVEVEKSALTDLAVAAAKREEWLAAREAEELLDSTARRLQDVEAGIQDLLETEGRAVARGMAEYILTSFQSHDPTV
ncbi:uncharacterized protein LOC112896887 [Panicum hallii]|uniref:uncharacterized protein LOC112896887 n=1 Tax=Panicum hallii TaxID=206008 RepID=UPI000DF4E657|nr:uncharacterized protein LOC112896887 [Panicum hallii]